MKCIMRIFAEDDKGVIFYETVMSLKKQRHTFIECVPLPWDKYEVIPGYFKVCKNCEVLILYIVLNQFYCGRNPSQLLKLNGPSTRS